jgi:hypothetical protein
MKETMRVVVRMSGIGVKRLDWERPLIDLLDTSTGYADA